MIKKVLVCGFNDELNDILEKFIYYNFEIFHKAFNLPGEKEEIITKFGVKFSIENYPILKKKIYNAELPLIALRKEIIFILVNLPDSDLKELLSIFLIMKIPLMIRAEKISYELKYWIIKKALYANVLVHFIGFSYFY